MSADIKITDTPLTAAKNHSHLTGNVRPLGGFVPVGYGLNPARATVEKLTEADRTG